MLVVMNQGRVLKVERATNVVSAWCCTCTWRSWPQPLEAVALRDHRWIGFTNGRFLGGRRFFAKYRPFVKPIHGPLRIAKAGSITAKSIETTQTLQATGLEDKANENESEAKKADAVEATRQRMTALIGTTPYLSLRFVQAFHATKAGVVVEQGREVGSSCSSSGGGEIVKDGAGGGDLSSSSPSSTSYQPNKPEQVLLRLKLDVDLTREAVRGTCVLPNGLDKKTRLLVFCHDRLEQEMLQLGYAQTRPSWHADFAGISEPIKKIKNGWVGFDRCIANQDIMKQVLPVAKILGPKRLMPSPRSGTVVEDLRAAIREVKGGGLMEYRCEGDSEMEIAVGDTSFTNQMILDNMKFFVAHLLKTRAKSSTSGKNSARAVASTSGGGGRGGGGGGPTNLIADARNQPTRAKARGGNNDLYITRASIRTETGPVVVLKPEDLLPNSAGYFR